MRLILIKAGQLERVWGEGDCWEDESFQGWQENKMEGRSF